MSKRFKSRHSGVRFSGWAGRGLVLGLFLFCTSLAVAQLTRGTISGSVTDQSGAAVPGAAITITNVDTGVARQSETGAAGRYEAPSLPAGNYEVSAGLAGFQTSIRSGIELTVGRHAVVDLVLQVGEVAQTVTVTGEVTFVETTTATVSQLVHARQVVDLPLNNRDLTQLVFLQPGVLRVPNEEFGYRSGMGDTLSVGGGRGSHNMYLLDGVSNSDFSGNAQGASSAYIGAETIKEFQIITNNYSAQYQSLPGAIISAVTKSGSNSLHGSLFEFLRNDNFDAFKWEDKARVGEEIPEKPEFKRNQFGGSLGGPIVRDRTFFFTSYEGLRERKGETELVRLPSADAHRGILPGEDPIDISAEVVPYLALYPIPGVDFPEVPGSLNKDGTVEITGTKRTPTNDDFVAAKIDHQFSDNNLLTGTYNFNDSDQSPFDVLGGLTSRRGSINRKHVVSVGHTSILSPTTLNEFKFGYTTVRIKGEIPLDDDIDWGTLSFMPGIRTRMGVIRPDDMQRIGQEESGAEFEQNVMTFKDGLSLTRGNHSYRMGVELNHFRYNIDACGSDCNGGYRFDDLESFLIGQPKRFEAMLPEGLSKPKFVNQLLFGAYFQDNYKVRDSLTLNLGMRYEFVTVPKEINGQSAALLNFNDLETTVGPYITNASLKSFSPRFGFAWAPGDRRTSLRGGFGIFYDHAMMYELRTVFTSIPPFTQVGRIDAKKGFIKKVKPKVKLDFPNAYTTQLEFLKSRVNLRAAQFDDQTAYIYRWSLNLQRELGADWVLSAAYTGSRAQHLWVQFVPNMNRWLICAERVACDGGSEVGRWPDNPVPGQFKYWPLDELDNGDDNPDFEGLILPQFGSLRWQAPIGNSYHHGLALSAQKRFSRGLQLQMSYNFSKTIDQGADVTSGELAEGQRQIYFWDMQLMKARSSQDIRHSLVTNFSYEVPRGDFGGIGSAILNGWQLNGILSLTSGNPFTIRDRTGDQEDRLEENSRLRPDLISGGNSNPIEGVTAGCKGVAAGQKLGGPDLYYDPCQFEIPDSRLGFFGNLGRSTLTSPGLAIFDLSVLKDFNVTEESRLQFRVEVFNLFNRPNFLAPNLSPWTSKGERDIVVSGDPDKNISPRQIDRTRGSARQIQFGLKYIF